mmetsp:Transcript_15194/g.32670  ORF Transcript_15194/g.32670 Transcript_15194/m.32670 type:complete len:377 (+) Transcript_15194:107-1237(+)
MKTKGFGTNTPVSVVTVPDQSDEESISAPCTSIPEPVSTRYKEKEALEDWHYMERDIKGFEILHDDYNYISWFHHFSSQMKYQCLYRAIDPNFNPDTLTDDYDLLLWERQDAYFWLVLLETCKSPISRVVICNHRHTQDGRAAFKELDEYSRSRDIMDMYSRQRYQALLTRLYKPGSRLRSSFVLRWFSELRQLDEYLSSSDRIGYNIVYSMIESAVLLDDDLRRAFIRAPTPTGQHEPDIENLKMHLYEIADRADHWDRRRNRKANRRHTHHDTQPEYHDDTLDFPTSRGNSNYTSLPEFIYTTLDSSERRAWQNLLPTTRFKIIHGYKTLFSSKHLTLANGKVQEHSSSTEYDAYNEHSENDEFFEAEEYHGDC